MAIYKRGGVYWIDVTVRGKRFRESAETIHKHEAEVYEDKRRKELSAGHDGKTANGATLHEAIEKAISLHWQHQSGMRTVLANARSIEAIIGGETKLKDIEESTVTHLIERLLEEENSPATINRKLSLLQKLLKMAAYEWRILERVPHFERFTERRGMVRVLSDQEESKLLSTLRNAGRNEAADLYTLLLDTGCHLGEALTLKWQDVSLDDHWITIRSGKSGDSQNRRIQLTSRTAAILSAHKERGDTAPFALTPNQAQYNWKWARKEMKLEYDSKFVIQALRHTCASRLVAHGADLDAVKNQLGHSTIKLTERYGHFVSGNLQDTASVPEERETNLNE